LNIIKDNIDNKNGLENDHDDFNSCFGEEHPIDCNENEQDHEHLWHQLKNIDGLVIKKCIYDFYYEDCKNDLFTFIENYYNAMIRFFLYISLIPRWIFWMTRNIFFFDLWKNPFLYYNKSCFKHDDTIDETYLSGMSYYHRQKILCNNDPSRIPDHDEEQQNISTKIFNDDTYKPNILITNEENETKISYPQENIITKNFDHNKENNVHHPENISDENIDENEKKYK